MLFLLDMVHDFHPIIITMANAIATFPLFKISKSPTDDSLANAKKLADKENVSLLQYIGSMLKHALRGHDLSKIHFYQDGSGDTYNEEVLDEMARQSDAESAAGLTTKGKTKEELFAHLRELRRAVDAGKEID
jgi:RNA-binding protein YhbY